MPHADMQQERWRARGTYGYSRCRAARPHATTDTTPPPRLPPCTAGAAPSKGCGISPSARAVLAGPNCCAATATAMDARASRVRRESGTAAATRCICAAAASCSGAGRAASCSSEVGSVEALRHCSTFMRRCCCSAHCRGGTAEACGLRSRSAWRPVHASLNCIFTRCDPTVWCFGFCGLMQA